MTNPERIWASVQADPAIKALRSILRPEQGRINEEFRPVGMARFLQSIDAEAFGELTSKVAFLEMDESTRAVWNEFTNEFKDQSDRIFDDHDFYAVAWFLNDHLNHTSAARLGGDPRGRLTDGVSKGWYLGEPIEQMLSLIKPEYRDQIWGYLAGTQYGNAPMPELLEVELISRGKPEVGRVNRASQSTISGRSPLVVTREDTLSVEDYRERWGYDELDEDEIDSIWRAGYVFERLSEIQSQYQNELERLRINPYTLWRGTVQYSGYGLSPRHWYRACIDQFGAGHPYNLLATEAVDSAQGPIPLITYLDTLVSIARLNNEATNEVWYLVRSNYFDWQRELNNFLVAGYQQLDFSLPGTEFKLLINLRGKELAPRVSLSAERNLGFTGVLDGGNTSSYMPGNYWPMFMDEAALSVESDLLLMGRIGQSLVDQLMVLPELTREPRLNRSMSAEYMPGTVAEKLILFGVRGLSATAKRLNDKGFAFNGQIQGGLNVGYKYSGQFKEVLNLPSLRRRYNDGLEVTGQANVDMVDIFYAGFHRQVDYFPNWYIKTILKELWKYGASRKSKLSFVGGSLFGNYYPRQIGLDLVNKVIEFQVEKIK